MDLIVLVILIAIVLFFFRDFKCFVYFMGIVEIFLRLVDYIGNNIGVREVARIVNSYFPDNTFAIIGTYANGLFYDVLCWLLVICYCVFLGYLIKYFFKRK